MGDVKRLPKGFSLTGSALYDRIVQRIRKAGWEAISQHGDTVKDIAERAGVGERTAERFIWGDTVNPWAQTVFNIAEAIGFSEADLLSEPERRRA